MDLWSLLFRLAEFCGVLGIVLLTQCSSNISTDPESSSPQVRIRLISKASSTASKMADSHSAQIPVIEQQRVIIPNKHREKLVGLLHETESKEIVVLCHGFRSSKDYRIMVSLAAALEKEGISVFRFDFSGNGESEGSFEYSSYHRGVDDLHAVIRHFSGENRAVSAILGHSKGGDVVLLYASKYRDIRIVVNVSGRCDMKRGLAERFGEDFMEKIKKDGYIDFKTGAFEFRVTEEELMDHLNMNMREPCRNIDRECRVLTVHGSADNLVPVEDASEFDEIIPNHRLQIIEGADHGYTVHQTELASAVVKFIKSGLEEDKVAPNR
ncbi:hypothetical protein V6N13_025886 [Hibiscus sabdariffa]|uniref:Serine aminopeptidase S33 domain-containing protein n=1 Tax=Hibiscus sabdariffa TaxID=183260 RepID=A0ABR2NFL3_9ROSI